MNTSKDSFPELVNIISVQTANGLKTIEIYKGDLLDFKINTDLLVFSAFKNDYYPLKDTLVGSISSKLGIDVGLLATRSDLDFRKSLNCWVSEKIDNLYSRRLICLEGIKEEIETKGDANELFQNMFALLPLLNYKNIPASTITLPLLGTGNQKVKTEDVITSLIEISIDALKTHNFLENIYFVEMNASRANLIDKTINNHLNRDIEKQNEVINSQLFSLYNEILQKLLRIKAYNEDYQNNNSFKNLIFKINSNKVKFYEIGILARKVMELLLREMTGLTNSSSLFEHINYLKANNNVANWMTSYLHILKNLSNYAAHEANPATIPFSINEKDRIIFSHLFNRFLEFYLDFKRKTN